MHDHGQQAKARRVVAHALLDQGGDAFAQDASG